jgi:hypothetical protein
MIGCSAALTRLRLLVEGGVAGAQYAISANRFKPTDDRHALEDQPEHAIHRRYEILPAQWDDGFSETGLANVSGQLVDSTLSAVLRVGYYFGGGTAGSAGLVGVTNEMAEDAFLLRRVLTIPANFSAATTGITDCRMGGPAKFTFGKNGDRRALLEMPLELMLTDDWSSEA